MPHWRWPRSATAPASRGRWCYGTTALAELTNPAVLAIDRLAIAEASH
jgi:hypothetical protein